MKTAIEFVSQKKDGHEQRFVRVWILVTESGETYELALPKEWEEPKLAGQFLLHNNTIFYRGLSLVVNPVD